MGYARSHYWERAFQYLGIVVSIVGKNRFQALETTIIMHSVRQLTMPGNGSHFMIYISCFTIQKPESLPALLYIVYH